MKTVIVLILLCALLAGLIADVKYSGAHFFRNFEFFKIRLHFVGKACIIILQVSQC